MVSPPFGEYTSGHSACSGASQRVFNLFAGSDSFKVPLSVTVAKGRSVIEPGDLDGRTLGSQIGGQAWTKAQTYFNGTAG